MFLIPDFSADKSAIVLKIHHCFSDGLGIASFCLLLDEQYDPSVIPMLKPLSFLKKMMIKILLPYYFIKSNLFFALSPPDLNCIKKQLPVANKRNGAYSSDIDLKKVKAFCKANKCTVNDYTTAVLTNSIYEFCDKHRNIDGITYEMPKTLALSCPLSLRQPFKSIKDAKISNEIVALLIHMPISKDLKTAIPEVQAQFSPYKSGLDLYGTYETISMTVNLPFTLARAGLEVLVDKYSVIYTNLFAGKVTLNWAGKKQLGLFYFPPNVFNLCCGMSLITAGDQCSFSMISDESTIKNP